MVFTNKLSLQMFTMFAWQFTGNTCSRLQLCAKWVVFLQCLPNI